MILFAGCFVNYICQCILKEAVFLRQPAESHILQISRNTIYTLDSCRRKQEFYFSLNNYLSSDKGLLRYRYFNS